METFIIFNVLLVITVNIVQTHAIFGYDCKGSNLNITTLSLLTTGDCNIGNMEIKEKSVKIQLLQLSDYTHTDVKQCLIEVDRMIFYCGMSSHMSMVKDGHRVYIYELSRESCDRLHNDHEINLYHTYLTDLRVNATETRSITIAGKLGMDGTCEGTEFSDYYGTWDKVVVTASVKITLKSFRAPIKYSSDQLILPGGQVCPVSKGQCRDSDGSDTYWTVAPTDNCELRHYDTLYKGQATKIEPLKNKDTPTIYTLMTKETTFALAIKEELKICGYTLLQTEHPKLFIFESGDTQEIPTRKPTDIENLDMFTYLNSKFVYVEKYLRTQMINLYNDVMKQKCLIEQQVLKQALTMIRNMPDEMAALIMKEQGYTAVAAGEVVHLVKCVPVSCEIRKEEKCYEEIPVTHQNISMFLTPKTRILVRRGTPRDCDNILPTIFNIQGLWYKFVPNPILAQEPIVIKPLTKPGWKYIKPENLATSGLYSEQDIERLHAHILFPIEKVNTLHVIAHGAMGGEIATGAVNLKNLLDENTLSTIAETAISKFWTGIVTFGNISAGIIAIFIIFKIVKFILDAIFHSYILHDSYGCGIHLLGSICNSLTQLIMYCANKKTQHEQNEAEQPVIYTQLTPTEIPEVITTQLNGQGITGSPERNSTPRGKADSTREEQLSGRWSGRRILKHFVSQKPIPQEALDSLTPSIDNSLP